MLTANEITSPLAKHPFLSGMDQECIGRLADWATRVEFLPDQYLCHARHAVYHLYLTLSGRVGLGFDHPSKEFRTLQTLDAPAVVGISWLSSPYKSCYSAKACYGAKACYDVKALTRSEAVAIDAVRLREALETDHVLAQQLYPRLVSILVDRLQASGLQLFEIFEYCDYLECFR